MTKISLKLSNYQNNLKTTKTTKITQNDQNTLETSKMTKICLNHQNTSGAKCQLIWSFWGQSVISRKSGIESVILSYLGGVNVYPFSFYFPSSTKVIQKEFQYAFYSGTKLFQTYNHLSKTMEIEYLTQIKLI